MSDEIKVIGHRSAQLGPYMPKERMMAELQLSVEAMIAAGTAPAGCRVADVRIREVDFLLERPDGQQLLVHAALIPADEDSGPQAFFAPGPGTKQ